MRLIHLLSLLLVIYCHSLNVLLPLSTPLLQFFALLLKCLNPLQLVGLALLSNERLLESVRNRAVIQVLVRVFNHPHFISHAHEQVASLSAVDRDLADDLIEALRVDLLPNRADA